MPVIPRTVWQAAVRGGPDRRLMMALGLLLAASSAQSAGAPSAAREWNESCLNAIRKNIPAPMLHARNLYHLSAAMYDAWAAYDSACVGVFHNESATAPDMAAARQEAVSYAAYRFLRSRYAGGASSAVNLASFDTRMQSLGYPTGITTREGPSPAAVGNRCASAVIAAGFGDGSNESFGYTPNTGYQPVNAPLVVGQPGTGTLAFPNRWQPLAFDAAFTQNGLVADQIQVFIGSHWGRVTCFALPGTHTAGLYHHLDPGPPAHLDGVGHREFVAHNVEVIRLSSLLDPAATEIIDISPGAFGNHPLGENTGTGHRLNPSTGLPYPANLVKLADFARVLAEYWADGPDSETPPGHWNVIANRISEHPAFEKRLGGRGPLMDDLEWDVKLYLALNAAAHDAAIAAWGIKAHYDYVRPVTSIRYMGGRGQSSDPAGPSFHPHGLPLVPGLIEVVTPASAAPGQRHQGIPTGKIAIRAWRGEPQDPANQTGGVGWIRADNWLPFQRSSFVTPAFAGYVSGHSTFSRAAAEVLTGFTGSPYFPGGLGQHSSLPGALTIENGPSAAVTLQWATYYDAADQAGISRLYGGIHVAEDDGPGRVIGAKVGTASLARALSYMDGSILDDFHCNLVVKGSTRTISWPCLPGFFYQLQSSPTLDEAGFVNLTPSRGYSSPQAVFTDFSSPAASLFYRVIRSSP